MVRVVGSGAYGVVISASDSKTSKNIAIKMVPKAFNDEIDAKRILREIKLLKHFRHENIVGITDIMPPTARYVEDFHDVYIVAELMETDLHRIIYSKQKLSIDHAQYFLYQLLRGLKYIHSADVIHRDLKPSNLLVNSNCDLKICDFGLARGIQQKQHEEQGGTMLLTEYVVTRWYRAPEIMLACHEYSKSIDIWSVGCIFAELIQRKPYFPGEDYIDQLTIITDKLGKLSEKDLDFVTSDKAKRFLRKLPNKTPTPLKTQFPNAPSDALDLMRKTLQIHPSKRITVEDALSHAFLSQLHSPQDEPACEEKFDYSFENEKLHRVRLQQLIWQEAGYFRPSCLPVAPQRGGGSVSSSRRKDP
ncbi:putative MAP kinase [Fragilariopsis cylindrus CCMP1102]|uniref:Mitogen-activated protein kinase n=1 Tax=Fragilariopsis cylindrus CCMP1102 TaxID=635003 RepID=A0A1E7EV81_9STRA|nr:putative MAP kinase [Fragilariopsis cylindrus CCMP1102]|eukprot:OEU09443.1 putative MAP kinase [Fragilariopsis cylindrus CCMP1102]